MPPGRAFCRRQPAVTRGEGRPPHLTITLTYRHHLLALASVGEDALDEVGRRPEIGREKSINVWAHGGDDAFPLGGEEDSEGSDDRDAKSLGEASGRTIVDYQEIGVGFQCETDGFALSWPKRGTQHLRAEGLCERPLVNPCGPRRAGRGLSRHGGRDEHRGKEPLQERELADVLEGDQRARVADDDAHRDLIVAFSAAHSSAVAAKSGIPRWEAYWMKSTRERPKNSPALPLEMTPRR